MDEDVILQKLNEECMNKYTKGFTRWKSSVFSDLSSAIRDNTEHDFGEVDDEQDEMHYNFHCHQNYNRYKLCDNCRKNLCRIKNMYYFEQHDLHYASLKK